MLKLQDLKPSSDWILEDSNEFLTKKCKDVTFPLNSKDSLLVNRMVNYIDACYENRGRDYKIRDGIAIAAPQVGCDKKIIYIHFVDAYDKEHKLLLANPEIVATSVACCYLKDGEGCLSVVDDHEGYIYRSARVKVKGFDILQNKEVLIKADGYLAVVLQHELDHFKGVLFYDHINKVDPKYVDPNAIVIE